MAFYPFQTQLQQLAGGTIPGNLTVTGTLTVTTPILGTSGGTGISSTDPVPVMMATESGYLAWTYDPVANSGSSVLASGTVLVSRINIRYAMAVHNISYDISVAGATLTAAENFVGLYNSAGTLIGTSADQTANFGTTGLISAALTGNPFNLSAGTFVWVAFLSNGTTPPAMLRIANASSPGQNAGLLNQTSRAATGPTAQTSLPASFTPSTLTQTGNAVWAALS